MYDAVWEPCKDVEYNTFVRRQNIAQVCSIENVLKSGKNPYPDRGSVFTWNKSIDVCQLLCSEDAAHAGGGAGLGIGV